ncbi:MAG: phage antirepressor [Culicoidibacterales bacterium]
MELQIFNNTNFGKIRTAEQDGKIYFVASDIAKALGYAKPNNAVNQHCKGATLKQGIITDSLGRTQDALIIPDGDVIRLITRSKLPEAEKFESWIFDEVIPSVLKHGAYMTPQALEQALLSPDFLIQLAEKLKEEQQKVKSLEDDVKVLEHRIAEHEPKLTYLDTILQSQETVAISQIAADYGMSAIRLNRILCDAKVQRKVKTQWILTSKYLNHGFTKSETINIRRSDGTFKPIMNTNWTQKGRLFIHDLLTNLGYIANFDADMEAI